MIAARYAKQSNWDAAIGVLHGGSLALLEAGQGGSGGDLGLLLIETLNKGEIGVDGEIKGESEDGGMERCDDSPAHVASRQSLMGTTGKIFAILRAFPPDEPTKKRFVGEAIAWSARFGEYPNGDPELHHVAGTLFAQSM